MRECVFLGLLLANDVLVATQFQGLLGWMDVHRASLLVQLPDGPLAGRRFLGRLMAFDPAVEAGLMAPQVMAEVAVRWPDTECGNRVTAVFMACSGIG